MPPGKCLTQSEHEQPDSSDPGLGHGGHCRLLAMGMQEMGQGGAGAVFSAAPALLGSDLTYGYPRRLMHQEPSHPTSTFDRWGNRPQGGDVLRALSGWVTQPRMGLNLLLQPCPQGGVKWRSHTTRSLFHSPLCSFLLMASTTKCQLGTVKSFLT